MGIVGLRADTQPSGIGWTLLAVALALPWLVETHVAPWTMFYQDGLMAAVLLALAGWACLASPARWRVTWLAACVGAFIVVPLLQAAAGRLSHATDGVLGALFLAGFGVAILTGHRAEAIAPGRVAGALFSGLGAAAIVSVGLQLYQWQGLDGLGVLVVQLPPKGRPFANVGQPNLLATLLVWGVIALWWAYEHRRIGATGGSLGAAFLLLGVAMTQSRTGWLEVALVVSMALARPRAFQRAVPRGTVLVLGLWFVALVLTWPALGSQLGLDPALALREQASAGRRPAIWGLGIEAIGARPWLGWGWNQGAAAHVALAAGHGSIQVLTPYMHNLALDLLLWIGIPLGVLLLLGFGAWFSRRWRTSRSASQRLLLLALATLLVHSMLELPHGHALFLLPAGLMIGMVEAHGGARSAFTIAPASVGAGLLVLTGALGTLIADHRAVEADLFALRMHEARIANLPPLGPAPRPMLMVPFGDLLASQRITPSPGMNAQTLDLLQRVAHRYPSPGNLLRLARAEAINGRPERAGDAIALLCHLQRVNACQQIQMAWLRMARADGVAPDQIRPLAASEGGPSAAGGAATMPNPSGARP